MMRSMFAGVSALRNHQIKMDVIGNNIANVNTIGFKSSRVTFKDMLSQTMRGASSPSEDRGGTNPVQVGLGMTLGSIDTIHVQGNVQPTGNGTDLAIEGEGFFVLSDGLTNFYTRAGAFGLDGLGNLVNPTGLFVMGYHADGAGNIDYLGGLKALAIDSSRTKDPIATTKITYAGNLSVMANGQLSYEPNPVVVSDGHGNEARLSIYLTPTGAFNEWQWEVTAVGGQLNDGTKDTDKVTGTIVLDENGNVVSVTGGQFSVVPEDGSAVQIRPPQGSGTANIFEYSTDGTNWVDLTTASFAPAPVRTAPVEVYDSLGRKHEVTITFKRLGANQWEWTGAGPGGATATGVLTFDVHGNLMSASNNTLTISPPDAAAQTIELDFSQITQYAGAFSAEAQSQNGFPEGSFETFSIDTRGVITARFSNGLSQTLGQIALAVFANPMGLARLGDNLFEQTNNSGIAKIDAPGVGSRGHISPSSVEMSNVDLAQEFTNMIVAQRGFQANSRVISASDEMLQELVNLKR